jgi:hypothetical protein
MERVQRYAFLAMAVILFSRRALASSGTEGASFLDIPVGAGPAALGSAYSAMASDAYAPVWNPAGLARIDSNQFAAQHLSYLETIHYEFASFVHPLGKGRTLGGSIQYLGSGDIAGTDLFGNPTADFSAHYAAYSLAYGQPINDKLSLGLTGKIINAKISDVSANAYAFDLGSMYQATSRLRLACVLSNVGTKLTFLDQSDSLPLAFHVGAQYRMNSNLTLAEEGVYEQTGLASYHTGLEWAPMDHLVLRLGYRTDTLKGLSPLAGLTTGIGLNLWGFELSYAWVPLGDLGNTQYFSLLMKFGSAVAKRNLIRYEAAKPKSHYSDEDETVSARTLMELLQEGNQSAKVSKNN